MPVSEVSSAVMSTSPLPWAAWPSPTWNSAPFGVNRQEQGGAGDQRLVVHVAAIDRRRRGIIAAKGRRRRDAHAAEKGAERNVDARREPAHHRLAVERDDLHPRIGEIVGQEAGAVAERVIGIGNGEIDLEDPDLERVAGFRTLDRDRAGQDVPARAPRRLGNAVEHRAQGGLDIGGCDAGFFQAGRAVGQQRMDDHRIAGMRW